MLNYHSYYWSLAGQSVEWLISDTQELYENNLLNHHDLLEKNGWVGAKFTYDFNSLGFRCDEFSTEPTIMFLGCSFTMGLGLPLEMTWAHLTARRLALRSANLGQGGGASDTAFRLCHGYIDKIQPKAVVFMRPMMYRFELTNDKWSELCTPQTNDKSEFYRCMIEFNQTPMFLQEKNALAIECLCRQRGIKFVQCEHKELNDISISSLDLARDLAHPGRGKNQLMADRIVDLLESTTNS